MGSESKKVLVAGDVCGRLELLFKRVAAVNKSNGPFDCLFCVGQWFAKGPAADEDKDIPPDLIEYLTGAKKPPVPTYFIGAYGTSSGPAVKALRADADGLCEDMFHLGRSGVMLIEGLRVAFLDGTYDAKSYRAPPSTAPGGGRHYCESDVFQLLKMAGAGAGEIDLLLTNDWPRDIMTYAGSPPEGCAAGSPIVADVAEKLQPRYHFAGGGMGAPGTFWQREPYKNPPPARHVTRFIGLAAVGNPGKHKSLHALAMVPAKAMDAAKLAEVPQGSTRPPYGAPPEDRNERAGASLRAGATPEEGGQQFRFQEPREKRQKREYQAWGNKDIPKDSSRTVYVKNVPWRCEPGDVTSFFSQCGEVEDIRRPLNDDGKLKGFCHVMFTEAAAVEKALVLSGTEMMGRELFIDKVADNSNRGQQQHQGGDQRRGGPPGGGANNDGRPVGSCWFCLSNPEADTHLVVSVGEECYAAVDKGAIVPMHVLVLPVEHVPNSLRLTDAAHAEVQKYLASLRACYAAQGMELVAFERFLNLRKSGGNHCHINVAPVPKDRAGGARAVFEAKAKEAGFAFEHAVPEGEGAREALRAAVGEGEFIRVVLPDGTGMCHVIQRGERHPMNYGREAMAHLLGCPERGDWKNCKLGKGAEERLAEDFKSMFQPYDFNLA